MKSLIIDILLGVMATYMVLGLVFSIYFYLKGAAKIDDGTKDTPWHFKVIIFPGVVLFWSILLLKLVRSND